ncbi:hypothetical protein [Sphingomonas sp. NIC1]|uniref:hypothetical protein n=1 Tax=Sphingomonas sp. NIC1 TaxID=1961362 RepID=UPI000A883AF1|nr:hypothetical protein [Sphingomonas sp. NIC1]
MPDGPIPVEVVKAWTPGAYAGWAAVIVQCFIALGLVIKKGPEWLDRWISKRRQDADIDLAERTAKAAEKAAEKAEEAAEAAQVAKRVDALEDRVTRMGQAVSFLMNAAITATNALPEGHPAIAQSRDLIALAASAIGGDDPFSKALTKLANVKGNGE